MSEFAIGGFSSQAYAKNGNVSHRAPRPKTGARSGSLDGFDWRTVDFSSEAAAAGEAAGVADADGASGSDAGLLGLGRPGKASGVGRGSRKLRFERSLEVLILVLGLVIAVAAILFFVPSALKVSRYEISGASSLSNAEVLSAALIHGNEYYFSLDTDRIRAALLAEPRIAAATVTRRFPNGLAISIVERHPTAIVLVEEGGRQRSVYLDEAGVAFAYAASAATAKPDSAGAVNARSDVPVISGLRFEDFKLGTKLPQAFVPVLSSLAAIEKGSPSLLAAFSEIKLVKPAYGEPELLLYPLHHRIQVRTGAVLNEETLRSIILVLDVLASRGLADGLEEIDFRTGTVVYRLKGGQAG
jgi:cell division protein FtsQ